MKKVIILYETSLWILISIKILENDAGTYKIVVKNKAGEVTANVNLNFSNEEESAAPAQR